MKGLRVFAPLPLEGTEGDRVTILRSPVIWKVVCCCLGPEGTNIEQAARMWLAKVGIMGKSEIVLCDTPELCLETARAITENGVVAVFWTCAVYAKESQFFFGNPDVLPFFFQQEMLLDAMQLATRSELRSRINDSLPSSWRIASHPSPVHLVRELPCQTVLVNSNAAAAKHCAQGQSDACITTESARKIHGLETVHLFGSPPMVFFGGVTQHGQEQIEKARSDWLSEPC